MAYEKQNWKTGDVVTSAKLNNMENGIADNSYDLVFFGHSNSISAMSDWTVADITVTGSIEAAEQKMLSGKPISAVLYLLGNIDDNDNSSLGVYPLFDVNLTYSILAFSSGIVNIELLYNSEYELSEIRISEE